MSKPFEEMTEEEKQEYVKEVIRSFAQAVKTVMEEKNLIAKKKLYDQLVAELQAKGPIIVSALLYAIKPEFKEVFIELFQALAPLSQSQNL